MRPDNIVICKNCDPSRHLWDSRAHLASLVGLWYTDDTDLLAIDGVCHTPSTFDICVNGDDYDFAGLSG